MQASVVNMALILMVARNEHEVPGLPLEDVECYHPEQIPQCSGKDVGQYLHRSLSGTCSLEREWSWMYKREVENQVV